MVSECIECGAKTTGKRKLCPDCRKDRKKDDSVYGRECIICGRELRTGRKYCYIHRNAGKERKKENEGIISTSMRPTGSIMFGAREVKKKNEEKIHIVILSILIILSVYLTYGKIQYGELIPFIIVILYAIIILCFKFIIKIRQKRNYS